MSWLMTSARRALWVVVLGAAGGTAITWWRERQAGNGPIDPPEWPPLSAPSTTAPSTTAPSTTAPEAAGPQTSGPETKPAGSSPSNAAAFVNALVDTPDARSTTPGDRWAAPNADGSCPDGFPIKANDNSGIFHVPTGRFYDRTKAERCYATAEGAESDGYRAAKS